MPETYSRKVFVGGLPPDIDQGINLSSVHFPFSRESRLLDGVSDCGGILNCL